MSQVIFDRNEAVLPRGPEIQKPEHSRLIAIVTGATLFFAAAWIAAFHQQSWEYVLVSALNVYARRSALLDRTVHALTSRDLLQGTVFIGLIWYLWFSTKRPDTRSQLLVGVVAASVAGIVSRLLQIALPTHLRPLHSPALHFVPPIGVEQADLNHFSSFPSDHGAVFFGLAFVILRHRTDLGVGAFLWATGLGLARVYDGFHYPSDIVGAAGLGVLAVVCFQNAWALRVATRALAFEGTRRGCFYMLAFVVSFQVATLFDDIREIGRGSANVLLHHSLNME
jgi:membrane-associated phospholipid phosphatase